MDEHKSPIVTFYSYKGGVGRSMALANVAWLLAETYKKDVLVIDWDLEAPGLHRFFDIDDSAIGKGLLDMLYDYKQVLREATKPLPENPVAVGKYIQRVTSFLGAGSISILPAGRQNDEYAGRVNEFDWQDFYSNWHGYGFIENLKKQLRDEAEIILVDSRTGVTDIGGICTLQMPDVAVLLFALNEQNISGVGRTADTILLKRAEVDTKSPCPKIILRPARVERYLEEDKRKEMEELATARLKGFLPEAEQSSEKALRYMTKKSIPYVGAYGFGETPLAVQKSPLSEIAEAFEDLAKSILDATIFRDEIPPSSRRRTIYRLIERYRPIFFRRVPLIPLLVPLLAVLALLFSSIYFSTRRELTRAKAAYNLALEQRDFAQREAESLMRLTDQTKSGSDNDFHFGSELPRDGPAAIEMGSATSFEQALSDMKKVEESVGNAKLVIYKKKDPFTEATFRIVAEFATRQEAWDQLRNPNRSFARSYIFDTSVWCYKATPRDGYIECQTRVRSPEDPTSFR